MACSQPHAGRDFWSIGHRQITAVLRNGGGISEYYAELYSAVADLPPLRGASGEHAMRWQSPEHRDIVVDPMDRMGYFALLGTLVDGTLAKWDRASMAHSLEVRVPFLDHRVVEFAWRLPPALKYANRTGSKHLLRQPVVPPFAARFGRSPEEGFLQSTPGLAARPTSRMGAGTAGRAAAHRGRNFQSDHRTPVLERAPRCCQRSLAIALERPDVPAMAQLLASGPQLCPSATYSGDWSDLGYLRRPELPRRASRWVPHSGVTR